MNHRRVILCGPTCSGKNFIREKFSQKGYTHDVSYTSREPRPGEINGIDYKFISKKAFEEAIVRNEFYEYVEYNGNYYGTGLDEWYEADVFIMETDGIKHIKPEDRKESLVIYVNTPYDIRLKRMRTRGWSEEKILERVKVDQDKFGHNYLDHFSDFDIEISSQCHGKGLPHFRNVNEAKEL
jgi:guanylate kinase